VRRIYPSPEEEVDLEAAYAPPAGRHVRANFVASVDGAASLEGASGGLSGPDDKRLFSLLRSLSDAILVGAETVRRERYGPVRIAPESQERRAQRGMEPVPAMVVVSGSLDVDPSSPLFSQAARPPIVVTGRRAPAGRLRRLSEVAEVIQAGEQHADLRAALDALAARGLERVLAEGGPSVLGQLLAGGNLDELCLTVSPLLAGAGPGRIVAGARFAPRSLELAHVLSSGGALFLRYRVTGQPPLPA
jgi:riboflavin biosynthesis pyrimidine reductase